MKIVDWLAYYDHNDFLTKIISLWSSEYKLSIEYLLNAENTRRDNSAFFYSDFEFPTSSDSRKSSTCFVSQIGYFIDERKYGWLQAIYNILFR